MGGQATGGTWTDTTVHHSMQHPYFLHTITHRLEATPVSGSPPASSPTTPTPHSAPWLHPSAATFPLLCVPRGCYSTPGTCRCNSPATQGSGRGTSRTGTAAKQHRIGCSRWCCTSALVCGDAFSWRICCSCCLHMNACGINAHNVVHCAQAFSLFCAQSGTRATAAACDSSTAPRYAPTYCALLFVCTNHAPLFPGGKLFPPRSPPPQPAL